MLSYKGQTTDRKKRNRALRRSRKKNKEAAKSDLGETSLTSSDLRNRSEILFSEARKTIEFGRRVGFEVEGDFEEAVQDMVKLVETQI
ncbi:hypothetical protein GQ457_09G031210 [Hibiscus cannabinus]